eukprot:2348209-Pyramimonas_sp.AAC.1
MSSCPTARVKYKLPTTRIKMTRNSLSRRDAFLQPDRAELKRASGNKIEYGGKNTRAQTNC